MPLLKLRTCVKLGDRAQLMLGSQLLATASTDKASDRCSGLITAYLRCGLTVAHTCVSSRIMHSVEVAMPQLWAMAARTSHAKILVTWPLALCIITNPVDDDLQAQRTHWLLVCVPSAA